MPYVSQETIDRVTNVLLRGNHAMKRAVLRETPINPPHGHTDMFTLAQKDKSFSKLKITDLDHMICFIKFGAVDRDQIGAMTFITKFPADLPTTASRAGWIPCWFLPWTSGHIIKMKISSFAAAPVINFAGVGIDPVPNPDLFFTAGINGCSVFGVGNADAPSIYHGGLDPGSGLVMPLQPNETTEMAWRRLLGRAHTLKQIGSVGKHDYISELNTANTTSDTDRFRDKGFKTTKAAAKLEADLEQNKRLTQVSVSPWGAVFGLRDTGTNNWTLTLVKNSTISYKRIVVTYKKRFLIPDKKIKTPTGESRSGGGLKRDADGLTDLSRPDGNFSETTIQNVVNLGFQEFFPGGGVTSLKTLDLTQVF